MAMDAFSVALAVGTLIQPLTGRHLFRLGWHFGLFQFLMPVIGYTAGLGARLYFEAFGPWVATGLLVVVGVRMLHAALRGGDEVVHGDPTRGMTLVVLSIATSIDALAIGATLAALGVSIWYPAVVIGLVAGVMTLLGMLIGSRLGRTFRRSMVALGGLILCGIAANVIIEYTL